MAETAMNRQSAPTLVFIHGSGDSGRVWDKLRHSLAMIAPTYSTVALDLPGHGEAITQPTQHIQSVADYAAAVRSELARRSLHQVCLVGHSLGCAIALRLAVDEPALVSHLIAIGGGARLRVLPALLEAAREQPERAGYTVVEMSFASAHTQEVAPYVAGQAPLAPGALYRDLAACDSFDVMAELPTINQPALVLVGAEDRLTPPKFARYLAEHLPHPSLCEIADAGHYVAIEQPEAVARAIHTWLSRDAE